MPPAVGRFSLMIDWPSGFDIDCGMTRATVSVGAGAQGALSVPGAKGTISVTGCVGYWADALAAAATSPAASKRRFMNPPGSVLISGLHIQRKLWRARRDSNPRPLASEANTLIR